jgi:hypothetical protein
MKPKKGVDEALGLPSIEEWEEMNGETLELYQDDEPELQQEDLSVEEAKAAMAKLKAMRSQLKDIPDITARKAHLDRLADLAERRFEDIFDRAFNCEDRFASEMINAANAMLKIALDAHAKIIDSDVKLVDLQIKKDKIEVELNLKPKERNPEQGERDVSGVSMSRNELLASRKHNNK